MGMLKIALFMILFQGCVYAYSDEEIVCAIKHAEGSWTYGIKSVKCETKKECRQICLNTVKNNRRRFAQAKGGDSRDFISFLAKRYCPIGSSNDSQGLNVNWERNVRFYLAKDRS